MPGAVTVEMISALGPGGKLPVTGRQSLRTASAGLTPEARIAG